MGKFYAGIGARATPEGVLKRMQKLSVILHRKGFTLRSGGARGADQAFQASCEDNCEIYLPSDKLPLWCDVFTECFHPNPNALKEYPRKLMNRNALQILGGDGNTPVDFVVCWTSGGMDIGGTSHALKIARHYNIPVYNLYHEEHVERLKQVIKETR